MVCLIALSVPEQCCVVNPYLSSYWTHCYIVYHRYYSLVVSVCTGLILKALSPSVMVCEMIIQDVKVPMLTTSGSSCTSLGRSSAKLFQSPASLSCWSGSTSRCQPARKVLQMLFLNDLIYCCAQPHEKLSSSQSTDPDCIRA
jgi:hypothetical protein